MSQKVLSVKVDPEDFEWFKEIAKGYKTQAEAFKALRQVYQCQTSVPLESLSEAKVYQKCVFRLGDKLPPHWELKTALEEKNKGRLWFVYPDDQIVTIIQKSPNGAKRWLEVAAEYPDEVWRDVKADSSFKYQPVTTLNKYLVDYQDTQTKMQHPAIAEAIAKGWETHRWHWDLEDLVKDAEDYLLLVNRPEPIQTKEVYQSVCETSEASLISEISLEIPTAPVEYPSSTPGTLILPISDLADRLAHKHIELSTAKTDRGRANVLKDLPATLAKIKSSNIAQWTTDRDPEMLAWKPMDETRNTWVLVNL
ncbi:MAG: hypothetical protein RM021_011855 [Nostoc sp. EkiNYC01]|nr:hypothetical protein [Nostoc sp. EkiNYC01]